MDERDRKLLDLVQRDAKMPQAQLAKRVGLSTAAVNERLRKLEKSGVIRRYSAVVDPQPLGNDITAFVEVFIEHPRFEPAFIKRVMELDEKGMLNGFKLRIRGQKERIVSGFHSAGFRVAAMGDSLNDLSLLRSCDFPVLFRPVHALLSQFPDAPSATNLDEALVFLEAAWRHEENGAS